MISLLFPRCCDKGLWQEDSEQGIWRQSSAEEHVGVAAQPNDSELRPQKRRKPSAMLSLASYF